MVVVVVQKKCKRNVAKSNIDYTKWCNNSGSVWSMFNSKHFWYFVVCRLIEFRTFSKFQYDACWKAQYLGWRTRAPVRFARASCSASFLMAIGNLRIWLLRSQRVKAPILCCLGTPNGSVIEVALHHACRTSKRIGAIRGRRFTRMMFFQSVGFRGYSPHYILRPFMRSYRLIIKIKLHHLCRAAQRRHWAIRARCIHSRNEAALSLVCHPFKISCQHLQHITLPTPPTAGTFHNVTENETEFETP